MNATNQFRQTQGEHNPVSSYEFGPFVLDTLQHALLKDGQPVALTPKTYDMLLLLVQNSGRMLSKDELMCALWPNSFVEESNLTQQVSMIRRALGESASDPRYIVTVPSCGYRFAAEVRTSTEERDLEAKTFAPSLVSDSLDGPMPGNPASPLALAPSHVEEPRKKSWPIAIRILAIAIVAVAALVISRQFYLARLRPTHSLPSPRSLAILPLRNLRQTPDDDFLSFSLADAIITKLDYVSSLSIRPSTAVEKYRNQEIDVQKAGADLNVDTLLTGSFMRDRDNLRITYQLIDVKGDRLLGNGTIDVKYDDLLKVQDSVAQRVIKNLQLNLSPSEAEHIKPDAPIKALAYEYFLRGVDLHGQHKFPLAIQMLEKSTETDPGYAPAWAYLGASYTSDAAFEFGGREQYERAQAAYEKALAIQPAELDAQIFLANLLIDTGKVEQAVPLVRDALKINSNYAAAHWELGYAYRFAGMLTESVAESELARRLDPSVKANGSVLNAYLYLGKYDEFLRSLPEANDSAFLLFYRGFGEYHKKELDQAARDFDRAFELDPYLYTEIGKALSDSISGHPADGLEMLRALEKKITERGVGDPEATYKIAEAYSVLGDNTAALSVLRRSVDGGFFAYPYLASDPLLSPLHKEAEFAGILDTAHTRCQAFRDKFF
jgi:DNA-binding winged helix-turn-helix (wHTH) protein/TolB-like protein/Tfp pilus assembly protein PilF